MQKLNGGHRLQPWRAYARIELYAAVSCSDRLWQVMTAHTASLVPRPPGPTGCEWLAPAMEMAAAAGGNWPPVYAAPVALTAARFPRVATRTPGLHAGSVRAARDFTRATLQRWGVTTCRDDVAVVMSELLTNALHHALPPGAAQPRWPIRLGLLQPGPCVLCAVADPSDQVPMLKDPDYLAESGRGLHVVASLSSGWGWTAPGRAGKIVWAMFPTDAPEARLSLCLVLAADDPKPSDVAECAHGTHCDHPLWQRSRPLA